VKYFLATTIALIFLISCNIRETAGTYVNRSNPNDTLILKSDKTFYFHTQFERNNNAERSYAGTYEIDGDLLILRNESGYLWKPMKLLPDGTIQMSDNPKDIAVKQP
jgi:hypothetical protein